MALIAFRHFPAVAALEEQLRLQSLGLLSDEEAGLLPILWRKLPLLNRSPRDRILSYSLMFVMAVNIIVITVMVEALTLVVWHVWR